MSVKTAAMDKMKNGNKPATTNGQKAAFPTTFKGYSSGQVGKFLSVFKEQVANALPKHIKPKRMIQVMTSLITRNPDLAECTTQSLVGSMLTASMLGLELVPQFGQCYLIPYKNKNIGNQKEAQFQLGYRGMLQLIQRHPMVKEAYAVKVYEEDTFHYEEGLNRDIKHIPAPDGEKKNLTHVYAVVKNINGGVSYVVLNRGDIARIREYSKSDKYDRNGTGFWNKHFDDMALKSAIRQLFKFAPVATDVQTRIGLDGKVINQSDAETAIQTGDFNDVFDGDIEEAEVVEETPEPKSVPEQAEAEEETPKFKPATKIQIAQIKYFKGDAEKVLNDEELEAFNKAKNGEEISQEIAQSIIDNLPEKK